MTKPNPQPLRRFQPWQYQLSFAAIYVAIGLMNAALIPLSDGRIHIWAPIGLMIGAFIRSNLGLLPGGALGEFVLNILKFNTPIAVGLSDAVADILVPTLSVLVLGRMWQFDPRLERMRDVLALVAVVCVGQVALCAFHDALFYSVFSEGAFSDLLSIWLRGALADLSGICLLAPILCTLPLSWAPLSRLLRRLSAYLRHPRALEAIGLFALAVIAAYFGLFSMGDSVRARMYLVFPVVMIAAFRFGPFGAAVGSSVTTLFAVLGAIFGTSPFVGPNHDDSIYSIALFLATLTLGSLFIAASFAEIKRSKSRFRVAKEVAEAAVQAKSLFLANLSHEFRTPMNAILGGTAILSEESLGKSPQDLVQLIRNAGEHLLGFIDDLLAFSQAEARDAIVENEPFFLYRTIEEALQLVPPKSAAPRIWRDVRIDSSCEVWVQGNVRRFRQVLINLVSNAVKFTREGFVRITATVIKADTDFVHVRCDISDSGVGISPEEKNHIFEPFRETLSDAASDARGASLGLAIAKYLAERLGGAIEVTSQMGVGSTFSFTCRLRTAVHPNRP